MSRGSERLFPKRSAHNHYVLTRLAEVVREVMARHVVPRAGEKRLLDYGSGDAPYRPLFEGKLSAYVTCDIERNAAAEVKIAADGSVPLADGGFDFVLSVQVLEHVDDVRRYLSEARRLLKDDGLLLVSTHGQWIWHPFPRDLWRWTREGLALVLAQSGFAPVETHWLCGKLAYGVQLWLFYAKRYTQRRGALARRFFEALCIVSSRLMPWLDRLEGEAGRDDAAIYFVVARKAAPGTGTLVSQSS